jgi:hypothetical protein
VGRGAAPYESRGWGVSGGGLSGLDARLVPVPVKVNSALVTTMRAADGKGNKYIAGDARCLIHTSDGKFVSVIESCDEVRELFTQR